CFFHLLWLSFLRASLNSDIAFPLTLTLSLGEREQQSNASSFDDEHSENTPIRFIEDRRAILPLPKREGRALQLIVGPG
ncbi:MAG TPA: hypothetical protein VJW76_01405, partial [Verrucomicrobiae bacterium]|nr:hypothetical protein [Verrucomicrobiae bacterium]